MTSALQIDKNMALPEVRDGLHWYDLRNLPLDGRGWTDVARHYARFPGRAKDVMPSDVWHLAQHSAGMSVRFCTDAPRLSARWTVLNSELAMPHMPATGVSGLDLYTRHDGQWRWIGAGRPTTSPTNTAVLAENLPGTMREYQLYLPLYNGVEEVHLGLPPESKLEMAPAYPLARSRPLCFYGTSIVQGGCASRPGMAHTSILARRLDWPTLNLGFSGSGKMEAELGTLLAELEAAAYILDCLPNLEEPQVTQRLEPFVKTLRAAHPTTPIVLVENVIYANAYLSQPRYERYTSNNAALQSAWARMLAAGIKGLYYVPCRYLLGDDGEATVDGTHPTDLGFLRLADGIEPTLRQALQIT